MTMGATFLSSRGWGLAYIVLAAHHLPEGEVRQAIRAFKSRLADCQRRGGMATGLWIETLEVECSTHANLIVAGTPEVLKAIRRLTKSPAFAKLDNGSQRFARIRTVYDLPKLLGYLGKEQTWFAASKTGVAYQPSPKRAIGDRVRLGRGLAAMMTAAGELKPYQRTYATPAAAKVAKPKRKPLSLSANATEATMSTDHETQAPAPRDPTAAERQRRCRARKRAERDAAAVTARAAVLPVTPAPVTVDEADDYPTQGTRWATVEVMYDDTDETVEAFAEAEDRCKADPTPDNVIAFEDARNRFYAGRWPPGRREPIRPTYYDVVTGELVA